MDEELLVFQRGRGRACVTGARKDSAEANALEAWLAERIDAACFEQRIGTGTFYVEYDDGAALSGRFIRSLRDKIHTLNRTKPEPFNIKPVHSLRGRVRLEVTGISERQLATLTMLSTGLPGVKRTKHRPGSRTTLVVFDPEKASEGFIRERLLKSNPDEWIREWHKLRDKIHTLNRTKPEPFNIKPVHSLRGRVRLEVTGISERQLATLTMLSTGLPGD